jgi:mono/diheme cytochrome c family protein
MEHRARLAVGSLLLLAGCGTDEAQGAGPSAAARRGEQLFAAQNCQNCHIAGLGFAPDLAGLSKLWTREDLARYIKDPPAFVETDARLREQAQSYPRQMPPYPALTDEELSDLAAYLLALE